MVLKHTANQNKQKKDNFYLFDYPCAYTNGQVPHSYAVLRPIYSNEPQAGSTNCKSRNT